jgi:hypothetical protein
MQQIGMDINKIDNVHPFYHNWYHPLWKEGIKSLQLSNYKDSPYYSLTNLEPTSNAAAQDPSSNITLEDTMRRFNSEIFDKIGHLGDITESQHINKTREHFNKLEKIAVKSVQSTKYAICSIIEVTNRLGSLSVSSFNSNIQVSAIDRALHRHQKHSLQNLSALKFLKRKVDTCSNNKTVTAASLNKKSCRVCHDHFKEPLEIYSTHHANSSKCPHFTTFDRKSPHEPNSVDDVLTDNNDILTDKNDKELLVSNSKCTSVEVDNDKLINLSTSIKSEANRDNSDDHSAYTTAGNYDSDNVTFEGKCKEPICPRDVIKYYSPIFVAGDPRGLRDTSVLAVDPNDNFPLVLSNAEDFPSTTTVKRIKVIRHNRLVDHRGIFQAIDWFQLKKRASATDTDGVYMQADCFEGIMKKHIIKGMGKAKAD